MEVRFYDDWSWNEYQGGAGFVSTLDNCADTPKNPIGFIWETPKVVLTKETNV